MSQSEKFYSKILKTLTLHDYIDDNYTRLNVNTGPFLVQSSIRIVNCVEFYTEEYGYQYQNNSKNESYQIQFSFHKKSQVPVIVEGGTNLLDCSKSNYKNFEHHIRCDKIVNCFHAEDEQDCEYDSTLCPRGFFRSNKRFATTFC